MQPEETFETRAEIEESESSSEAAGPSKQVRTLFEPLFAGRAESTAG